jgi:hypothetical protein
MNISILIRPSGYSLGTVRLKGKEKSMWPSYTSENATELIPKVQNDLGK